MHEHRWDQVWGSIIVVKYLFWMRLPNIQLLVSQQVLQQILLSFCKQCQTEKKYWGYNAFLRQRIKCKERWWVWWLFLPPPSLKYCSPRSFCTQLRAIPTIHERNVLKVHVVLMQWVSRLLLISIKVVL